MIARTVLCTAIVTLTLAATLAHAGPRTNPHAQAVLDAVKSVCAMRGEMAYKVALNRDGGESVITVLGWARQWDQALGNDAATQRRHETMIRNIYLALEVDPASIRHLTESKCLQELAPLEDTTTPTVGGRSSR
jgi:hypothetical protein